MRKAQTFNNSQSEILEEKVQCPFDPSHMLTKQRLQQHLTKCRKNLMRDVTSPYHEKVKDMQQCLFYTLHWYPSKDIASHMEQCPYQAQVIRLVEQQSEESQLKSWTGLVDTTLLEQAQAQNDAGDNWDDELETAGGGTTYDPIKEKIEKNPHFIYNIQGQTKSARRKYQQERGRAAAEYKGNGNIEGDRSNPEPRPEDIGPVGAPPQYPAFPTSKGQTPSASNCLDQVPSSQAKFNFRKLPHEESEPLSYRQLCMRGVGRGRYEADTCPLDPAIKLMAASTEKLGMKGYGGPYVGSMVGRGVGRGAIRKNEPRAPGPPPGF